MFVKGRLCSSQHGGLSVLIISSLSLVVLTACSVGPDFRRPDPPDVKTYTQTELPGETAASPVTGGEAQRFRFGHDIPAEWWNLFHSEALNEVIRQALVRQPQPIVWEEDATQPPQAEPEDSAGLTAH